MNQKRKQAEQLIYDYFDTLDKTQYNTSYYKALFSKMSDSEFTKFCARDLPFRFQEKPFVTVPTMSDIEESLDLLGTPLLESVALPYLYKNNNGEPVWSKPCMVIYIHLKKMKQFITKKNSTPSSIDRRDMKTGLLVSLDKGGKTSDREMESLVVMGLEDTMEELSTWRADYMDAKSIAYQRILADGEVNEEEIPITNEDSLSKNMLNYYMLGSMLYTNIINVDYMLPKTVKDRQAKVIREVE